MVSCLFFEIPKKLCALSEDERLLYNIDHSFIKLK